MAMRTHAFRERDGRLCASLVGSRPALVNVWLDKTDFREGSLAL